MVHEFCYLSLGRWYINLSTKLMREDGTYISLPYSREEVVPNFQYQALEGGRYINFSTTLSRGRRWYLNFVTIVSREGGTEISLPYS